MIDFGLAKVKTTKGDTNEDSIAGTPLYMAPEVLDGNYGPESDLWAIGVMLYTLVSGYMPFYAKSRTEVFDKIRNCKWHF